MAQGPSRLYLVLAAILVTCNRFLGVTSLEVMKGLWRADEAWHCESPGEGVGEGVALVAEETPGLKES